MAELGRPFKLRNGKKVFATKVTSSGRSGNIGLGEPFRFSFASDRGFFGHMDPSAITKVSIKGGING